MDLENENQELLNQLHECQDEKVEEDPKTGIKKGSKTDLINEIFNLCKRANIPCEHTESQLKRINKKKLLEVLAIYCEKAVEKKILEKCKIKQNMDHMDDAQKTKMMNIGILRMAHDSLCYAAESLTHRFSPFTIEGMTHSMKESKDISDQIDQCLAEIAEEYEVLQYIESPTSRLMLIWISSGVSKLRRKTVEKKNDLVSKRVRFEPTQTTHSDRSLPVRRPTPRQVSHAGKNTKTPIRRI